MGTRGFCRQLQGMCCSVRPLSCTCPDYHSTFAQLETDEDLLIPKARAALERYGHQVVVGNELNKRKYEVVFVERRSAGDFQETWVRLPPGHEATAENNLGKGGEREIEEDIVRNLRLRHERWISEGPGPTVG